jgi:hypothetical protein
MHTTNYFNTLILVAEDCSSTRAEVPPTKGDKKTIANWQFELVYDSPFQWTSDDLIFHIHAIRNEIKKADLESERMKFFSKGQPCLRTSPLAKTYGWGVYSNGEGKIELIALDSERYEALKNDESIKKVFAMKSKR